MKHYFAINMALYLPTFQCGRKNCSISNVQLVQKEIFHFLGLILRVTQWSTCSSIEPSRTWMGDRLCPRSKSELQLAKHFFLFFLFFNDFFLFWPFSRNFQTYETIRVVFNCFFTLKQLLFEFSYQLFPIQSIICATSNYSNEGNGKKLHEKAKNDEKSEKKYFQKSYYFGRSPIQVLTGLIAA